MKKRWALVCATTLCACGGEQRDVADPGELAPTSAASASAGSSASPAATVAPSAAPGGASAGVEPGAGGAAPAVPRTVPLLTADLIREAVRPQYPDIAVCYQEGLSRDPQLAGTVEVALTIGGDGSVIDAHQKPVPKAARNRPARHADDPITDGTVVDCVVTKFKALRFPASRRGMMTTVYPIVFATE